MGECGRTAGRNGQEARTSTAGSAAKEPGTNGFWTPKPKRKGRHAERRILAQQGCELVYVVSMKRIHILFQKAFLRFRHRGSLCNVATGKGSAGSLQSAIDGRYRGVQALGHFRSGPAEHFDQEQHGSLLGWQVLQRGHEREADAFAHLCELGGIGVSR